MAFDPYDPCPCGSGKKFKWCCQPVHVQIDKAFQQDAQGQHEVALKMMDSVCAEHPGNPEVWGRKAQLLYQMDKAEDAENALQKAFDLNPQYPFGLYLRGRFRHFEGEIPGALMLFRQAVEAYDPNAHEVLGHLYSLITDCELKLNRPVAARAALEMAVKEQPTLEDYRKGLEQAFGAESKFPDAAKKAYDYQKLPANVSPERQAAWQRALQTATTGKLTDAVKAFEQLTTEDNNDSAALFNLGLSKAWLGDNAGAVTALERSVQLDQDEDRAAQTWTLTEVLLCGQGLEEQANFVEYSITLPIRNPEQFVRWLQDLQTQRRLIGVQTREQEGMLTGVLVEKVQALTAEHAANQVARLGAYLLVIGGMVRLWGVNKETFDSVTSDAQQLAAGALGEAYQRLGPAHFEDVLSEAFAFPMNTADQAKAKQQMADFFQTHMEEKWIHKPLKALGHVPPIDAAGHATLRRKLRGHIQFLADCAKPLGNDYDFDRLRRKVGLLAGPAIAAAAAGPDISAMSAAELAALKVETLDDKQLDDAFQAALKLAAQELAGQFAKALAAKPPRADKPDRYVVFNHLIQQALNDGNIDAALDFVNDGEKTDCEHNEGRRRNDYELRRGQILVKRGDIKEATEVFDRLLDRAPAELRYRGTAAEAMLSAKRPTEALRFAEAGLKKSREQNNRDSEQYFMELTAAAKKQGG